MWKRKELKVEAKSNLKKNYWAMIAVCFILAILAMEYSASTQIINEYDADRQYIGEVEKHAPGMDNSEIVDKIMSNSQLEQEFHPTKGVFGSILNMATKSKMTINNLSKTLDHVLSQHGALAIAIGILAILLSAFYELFIKSLLKIGERRFFLENHLYHKTSIGRIFFLFKEKKKKGPIWTILVMNIYQGLWNLTIIGGFIKHYSYKMIPYIIAENPEISRKDAFMLSRKMMNGNKWRAFVLDLSFFGWYLLLFMTVGLLGLFFVNPYQRGVEAALYFRLRSAAIEQNMAGANALTDRYLVEAPAGHTGEYYPGLAGPKGHKLAVNYHRNYSIINLVLFFFTAAFIGWCWEVFLHLIQDGVFVNRGTMFGPWLPIYGVGGVAALILLKRFIDKPAMTFGLTMVICGIVEYVTSWFLEVTKGVKWWDYSGFLLNLNGRICLEGLLTFAIAGCAFIYIIAPRLDELYNRIPAKIKYTLCACFVVLFGIDTAYSHFHPNMGAGITDYGMTDEQPTIVKS